ncbi:uncharacterized protein LOC119833826 [Zerene cesonia]|uniref:uncharacterized protein LOC119833826 n=1 Tax=Zerene cesonia TaxID=33412 RepID=UPI0018E55437|nr:uncharacterized protein LOC119833826 [Zerene cesonia]
MLIFKSAFIVFFSTFIVSLSSQIAKETNSLDTGLACLYIISGAFAGKILYDRYQHIHILGSLTPNPNVTSYVNRIASICASFLSLGFLGYFYLLLFKDDEHSLKALNIFLCGFGTLYMWLQCLLTTYISTLFYEKRLTVLRQCLANLSFLFLVIMAIFGIISVLIPEDGSSGMYICNVITSLSSYILTTIFCIFILSYEKEYKYFSEGLRSDMLIDDACSLNNSSIDDTDALLGTLEQASSTINNNNMIKRTVPCAISS